MSNKIEKPAPDLAERLLSRSTKIREMAGVDSSVLGLSAPNREILVLLLDVSASMGSPCEICAGAGISDPSMTKLQALQEAIKTLSQKILSRIPPTTYLQIVEFDSKARYVPVTGAALAASGDTNMIDGMDLAFEVLRKASGFRSHRVILMSDGRPTCSYDEVKKKAAEFALYGFVIDTVAFGADADARFLKDIADATGGISYEASSVSGLVESFALLDTPVRGLLTS